MRLAWLFGGLEQDFFCCPCTAKCCNFRQKNLIIPRSTLLVRCQQNGSIDLKISFRTKEALLISAPLLLLLAFIVKAVNLLQHLVSLLLHLQHTHRVYNHVASQ